MAPLETVETFYQRLAGNNKWDKTPGGIGTGHFNVFERNSCAVNGPYSRRDFYKITLIIGTGRLYYADKWIYIDKPALLFSNPLVPYCWEPESIEQAGWFCIFTESFILPRERTGVLHDSPLFKIGAIPVFFPNGDQQNELAAIFRKMLTEIASGYKYKYEVLRNYLHLLIHEAMKTEPGDQFQKHKNASSRICSLFLELLERQFPIDNIRMQVKLKTAVDFARSLSVHVNHLNRSVKSITGKTTTEHIQARLTQEASALLQHTDWTVSEIANCLGFEYPSYFTNFFKKQTHISPNEMRKSIV